MMLVMPSRSASARAVSWRGGSGTASLSTSHAIPAHLSARFRVGDLGVQALGAIAADGLTHLLQTVPRDGLDLVHLARGGFWVRSVKLPGQLGSSA